MSYVCSIKDGKYKERENVRRISGIVVCMIVGRCSFVIHSCPSVSIQIVRCTPCHVAFYLCFKVRVSLIPFQFCIFLVRCLFVNV